MNFEEFFQRVRTATGMRSQKELASFLGIGPAAITLAKRRGVPKTWSLKIASVFNLNPGWLESGQGPVSSGTHQHAFFVPKVSAKACAGGGSFEIQDHVIDEIPFTEPWLRKKGCPESMVAMQVTGDSMSPELEHGDDILVDLSQKHLMNQSLYVLGLEDAIHVKRIESTRDIVILLSTNRKYSPVTLQGQEIDTLRIIGRVLWSSREY
jgi:phage repressor protein C with HTH and peptisase S24 domain